MIDYFLFTIDYCYGTGVSFFLSIVNNQLKGERI